MYVLYTYLQTYFVQYEKIINFKQLSESGQMNEWIEMRTSPPYVTSLDLNFLFFEWIASNSTGQLFQRSDVVWK